MLTVGSLFAGIGGFDLGLERAGMRVIWQSEIDPYASAVLRKHWPNVPNHGDIRSIRAGTAGRPDKHWPNVPNHGDIRSIRAGTAGRPDVICGGFPCQPFSYAGKRGGKNDDRYLWPEMLRVIAELRPAWVIGENVAGIISMELDAVLSDLEALGYATRTFVIPAVAVDAPHRRDRVWIIARDARRTDADADNGHQQSKEPIQARRAPALAVRDRDREPACAVDAEAQGLSGNVADAERERGRCRDSTRQNAVNAWQSSRCQESRQWLPEPDVGRVVARLSARLDGDINVASSGTGEILCALRNGISADAIQWPVRGLGRFQTPQVLLAHLCEYSGPPKPLGNVSLAREETPQVIMRGVWFNGTTSCSSCRRIAAEQRDREHPDVVRVLSQLLACDCGSAWLDPTGTPSESSRVARLRCLGNAIVPQIAEILGRAILESEAAR